MKSLFFAGGTVFCVLAALTGRGLGAAEFEILDKLKVDGGIEVSTSPTASALIFASSTTNQGNVGIGTTIPAAKLDIVGTLNIRDTPTIFSNKFLLWDNGGSQGGQIGSGGTNSNFVINGPPGTGALLVNFGFNSATNGLLIYSGGISPAAKFRFNPAGDSYLIGGNVGIGTITPDSKLRVEGSLKIVDGTQGAGKVLVSDSNGLASWQDNFNVAIASTSVSQTGTCCSLWQGVNASTVTIQLAESAKVKLEAVLQIQGGSSGGQEYNVRFMKGDQALGGSRGGCYFNEVGLNSQRTCHLLHATGTLTAGTYTFSLMIFGTGTPVLPNDLVPMHLVASEF